MSSLIGILGLALIVTIGAISVSAINSSIQSRPPKPKKLSRNERRQLEIRNLERENADLDQLIDKIKGNT